jgi:hypothetical protein
MISANKVPPLPQARIVFSMVYYSADIRPEARITANIFEDKST